MFKFLWFYKLADLETQHSENSRQKVNLPETNSNLYWSLKANVQRLVAQHFWWLIVSLGLLCGARERSWAQSACLLHSRPKVLTPACAFCWLTPTSCTLDLACVNPWSFSTSPSLSWSLWPWFLSAGISQILGHTYYRCSWISTTGVLRKGGPLEGS